MAALPDALPMADVNGTPLPVIAPAPTDFGLERAGAELGQVADSNQRLARGQAREQARADAESAQRLYAPFAADRQIALKLDAAAYTGETPGFHTDQLNKDQAASQAFLASQKDVAPGVRTQLQRLVSAGTLQRGAAAGAYEGSVRAVPIAQQTANLESSQVNTAVTAQNTPFATAQEKLYLNHVATDTDLPDKIGQAFDAAAAPALAAAPDYLRPRVQAELAVARQQALAKAADFQSLHQDGQIIAGAHDQISTLANTTLSAPSSYDHNLELAMKFIDTLPAGLQDGFRRDAREALAQTRVQGLIDHGQSGLAANELDTGRFDHDLKPETKQTLLHAALADGVANGPQAIAKATQAILTQQAADADLVATQRTGKGTGFDPNSAIGILSPEKIAQYNVTKSAVLQDFAVTGGVHAMSMADLQAGLNAPEPKPSATYAQDFPLWQAKHQAYAQEVAARQKPGNWAFTSSAGKDVLKANWDAVLSGDPAKMQAAAPNVASWSLTMQAHFGVPAGARQLIDQSEAARLAALVTQAPPEKKAEALASLGSILQAFPATFRLDDGSFAAPRGLLAKQLLTAGLDAREVSAIVDFHGAPAKLGRVVAALNDTTLKGALPHGQQAQLTGAVKAALAPYLDSLAAQPGESVLAQARIDRTALVARELMASQHLSPADAAKVAATDAAGGYRFIDHWRMPAGLAGGASVNIDTGGLHIASGADLARTGAARMLAGLLSNNGANLYAPGGGDPASQRRLYAVQVQHSAQWRTTGDDAGLALMVPHPDGTWDQVADRYGRPIRAGWSDLQGYAQGRGVLPFTKPPAAGVLQHPDGTPVPAASSQTTVGALIKGITHQESGFRDGLVSDQGAMGRMQLLPATAAPYAQRLFGQPLDQHRLLHDGAYNTAIGSALAADLVNHFGPGPGLALATAAYFAGQGNVEGYSDVRGYHPGFIQRYGDPRRGAIGTNDWVDHLPPKTKAYVKNVLSTSARYMQAGG